MYRNLYVLICVSLVRGKYYCAWKLGQFRPIKTAKKKSYVKFNLPDSRFAVSELCNTHSIFFVTGEKIPK